MKSIFLYLAFNSPEPGGCGETSVSDSITPRRANTLKNLQKRKTADTYIHTLPGQSGAQKTGS